MQHAVLAWLAANWFGCAAVAVYASLEWWLPRTKWFKANSTIEALANVVKATLLSKVPLVGWAASKLATPAATAPVLTIAPDARTKDQG
jgi:hypothetical protein